MVLFRKLKSGGIIFVLGTNMRVVHGVSFLSPELRHRNYRYEKIDWEWTITIEELRTLFDAKNYVYRESKHIKSAEVLKNRITKILNALYPIEYKNTG